MNFSEYLSDYMARKELKWLTASKLCGVDRQQLKRYTSGFAPKNIETVITIADGLGMTEAEKMEFCRLYQRHKMGDDRYLLEMYIHHLFCQTAEDASEVNDVTFINGLADVEEWDWTKEQVSRLVDSEQLYRVCGYLIRDVEQIRIKMNWSGKESRWSRLFARAEKKADIQQIVEINAERSGQDAEEIKELEACVSLFQNLENYQVYCHYQWEQTSLDGMEGLNFLLSDKGIVLFDESMQNAIFANKQGYVEYYKKLFARGLAKCNMFAGSVKEIPVDMKKDFPYLQNKESRTIFFYQKSPKEIIWVNKEGARQEHFYVEEMRLVQLFKEYMRKSEVGSV